MPMILEYVKIEDKRNWKNDIKLPKIINHLNAKFLHVIMRKNKWIICKTLRQKHMFVQDYKQFKQLQKNNKHARR